MKPVALFLTLVLAGLTIYLLIDFLRRSNEKFRIAQNTPKGPVGFKAIPPEPLCT